MSEYIVKCMLATPLVSTVATNVLSIVLHLVNDSGSGKWNLV
jgi:hypothetical protein